MFNHQLLQQLKVEYRIVIFPLSKTLKGKFYSLASNEVPIRYYQPAMKTSHARNSDIVYRKLYANQFCVSEIFLKKLCNNLILGIEECLRFFWYYFLDIQKQRTLKILMLTLCYFLSKNNSCLIEFTQLFSYCQVHFLHILRVHPLFISLNSVWPIYSFHVTKLKTFFWQFYFKLLAIHYLILIDKINSVMSNVKRGQLNVI